MCLALQEQPSLSILCRLQVATQVARSQALTELPGAWWAGTPTVVSAGDTASDLFARPHFGTSLVPRGLRTLGSSQSTLHRHHHCCPVLCSLYSCFHRPSGSLKAHRTTPSWGQAPELPARSCKASLGEVAWGRSQMDPVGRRSPPGQQCYSFLRVKLAAHHSSGASSNPNRSAPARLLPGVTFQQ